MEACGSAHYWAREVVRLGHEVKLISPRYVKPFVKRQKNDAADAEAIVVAAQRPEMRFVAPKTAEQQSSAILFRARERFVHQRTELINALRASLYEYGHVVPQGVHQTKRIAEKLDAPSSDLPDLMCEECQDLPEQIAEKTVRINDRTAKIKVLAAETDTARFANHTRGRSVDSSGGGSFCPADGELWLWSRFCGLARACPASTLVRW